MNNNNYVLFLDLYRGDLRPTLIPRKKLSLFPKILSKVPNEESERRCYSTDQEVAFINYIKGLTDSYYRFEAVPIHIQYVLCITGCILVAILE